MSAISGISPSAISVSQLAALYQQSAAGAGSPTAAGSATPASGNSFGSLLSNGISSLESLNQNAQTSAVAAATGNLTEIQDYVIAASKAQVATELTTTLRNKALDSFNEIMRMPL
jgi:flagellar hook-basal body complex protein FliE